MAAIGDRLSRPWLGLRITGIGPDTDAAGTAQRYTFSSMADPGVATGTWWRPYLADLPDGIETTLDPVTGEVSVGSLTADLVEGPGSVFLTELFAVRERAQRGSLAASITAAAVTMDVNRLAGAQPAVGQVLSIGDERMRITASVGGGGVGGSDRLTVTRAYYGTTARTHEVASDWGDAEVRYRAHWWRGRLVEVLQGFYGDAIPAAPVAAYLLDSIEIVDGSIWRLTMRGVESLLDTECLTHAWEGLANNPFAQSVREETRLDRDAFAHQSVRLTAWQGSRPEIPGSLAPSDLRTDAAAGCHMRIGDACVQVDVAVANNIAGIPVRLVDVDAGVSPVGGWRVARTPVPTSDDPQVGSRQVWPTDKALDHGRFAPDPTGAAPAKQSDHPIDILLCMMLSTGLGTNFGAGETSYDVLPGPDWGRIPADRVDVAAWEAMKLARLPSARAPNLVVGWDGPLNLADFARRALLGPLGIAAVQDAAGRIRPVRLSEVFPSDAVTALGSGDIIAGSETWTWDGSSQVSSQVWEWDHDGPDGRPRQIHRVLSPEARIRQRSGDDRTLTMVAQGHRRDAGGLALILERGEFLRRHFGEPPPLLTLGLNWQHMHLVVGSAVTVTLASVPNPATGTRGITAQPFIVIGVRRRWRDIVQGGSRGGGVTATLFWVGLDSPTLVHYAPSAVVGAGDAATGTTVTVSRNEFSNGTLTGPVPADDTGGFQAGGVGTGDLVTLRDSDGATKAVTNTPRVTATTATTLVLSDVFRDGGGVEVARVVGDTITYCGDTGAASYPASAWTARMREHGAFSDVAAETIGTTARTAHYGD